jgi:hypothetical protein
MSLSVFLLLEPEGQRATKNLKILLQLLGSNVKQEDEKNVTITLSPQQLDTKERGEDDFHRTEFLLTMQSALDHSEKYKDMPAALKLKEKLELIVTHDAELNKKNKQGFFTRYYLPFLKQMKENNVMETACYIMYTSSDDAATAKWLEENKTKVEEFYKWLEAYKWIK